MRTYNFHTNCDGVRTWAVVRENSLREALATLFDSLRDGETVEGFAQTDDQDASAEVEALRAVLRKVQSNVGNWAALSYVDGVHGRPCERWTADERALLRRAGL